MWHLFNDISITENGTTSLHIIKLCYHFLQVHGHEFKPFGKYFVTSLLSWYIQDLYVKT